MFYQQLAAPVLIGMEATGNSQWFTETSLATQSVLRHTQDIFVLDTAFSLYRGPPVPSAMNFSLETCQRGAGAVDYYNALKNVVKGRQWNAGPRNPFTGTPAMVNGYPDYGDQTHYAENESVIAGWMYGSGGCR
jgi:hypothetical protein